MGNLKGHIRGPRIKPFDPERQQRKCLACRYPFMSEWAGHRVCDRCKTGQASQQSRSFGEAFGLLGRKVIRI